jgi:hypothetical protein
MQLGGNAGSLHPFIWSHVSGLMQFRNEPDGKCASNYMQISENLKQRTW